MKFLPKADFETDDEAHVLIPKLHSRRQTVKLMVMGVVGLPSLENIFDGKIYNERVSIKEKTTRTSFNQHISSYYKVNHALKREKWKKLFIPTDLHL